MTYVVTVAVGTGLRVGARGGSPACDGVPDTGRMDSAGLALVALAIAVGIAGTVVPVLPGLPVVWLAVLAWTLLDGGGPARWAVLALVTAVTATGVAAKYVLSSRRMRERGAPRSTLLLAGLGGVVGFFVVPVVGIFVGLAAGAYAAEYSRLRDPRAAWSSAWSVLVALGIGTLIEIAAGLGVFVIWAGAELLAL